MYRKMFIMLALALAFTAMPWIAGDAESGGGGRPNVISKNFGLIYDLRGFVELKKPDQFPIALERDKHILHLIQNEDKIRTSEDSMAIILSLGSKLAYELAPSTLVHIKSGKLFTIRGKTRQIGRFYSPRLTTSDTTYTLTVNDHAETSCLNVLTPVDTFIISVTPKLRWLNLCPGSKQVMLRIIHKDKIIYQVATGETQYKVPKDLLEYDNTYQWYVDGDSNGISGGTFSIKDESSVKNILKRKLSARENPNDITSWLSYIFFLRDNKLKDMILSEVKNFKDKFPDNPYMDIQKSTQSTQ